MLGPDRYATAKRVFLEASRMPRGDRTRFVLTQCEGDDELCEHVRRLLTVDESADEFLERPALAPAGSGLAPGTRLGRYRVVRLLGEGGMGVVYEAEQDEPARHVALKIIRAGYLSERLRSRFRHEIRVLGQLRHPGIAQIYDAGTLEVGGERVPYFAMELIEGRLLLACAEALKLGVRGRLELVAQVCDAVHHAHQKGVIHRDLKPANILVEEGETERRRDEETARSSLIADRSSLRSPPHPLTPSPPHLQVKVLDFGVARVTDADVRAVTIQTSAQQLVGTVPYMSPEQAAADPEGVDIRTDVYSIGVVAFELLAKRLPHAIHGRALHEAVRAIREDEPARLGSIDRALRGDIDTIIAKALEKDRDRRYGSAAEMAADIRRFLRDEPIAARPPSALYHLRTYARRHKPLVAAAAIAFAAMVAATAISTWQALVAVRARAAADRNAAEAQREANRAGLAAASAALGEGDPISARNHLDAIDEPARGWAWHYWNARHDRSIGLIEPGEPVAGAWFAEAGGDVISIVTQSGAVRTWDPWRGPQGEVVRLDSGPVWLGVPAGDERVLAVHGSDQTKCSLSMFDTTDGHLIRRLADDPTRDASRVGTPSLDRNVRVAASADGGVLAALVRFAPVHILLWRAPGTDPISVHDPQNPCVSIALSADGRMLGGSNAVLTLWDLTSTAAASPPVHWRAPLGWDEASTALSADGRFVVTGGNDRLLRVWDGVSSPPPESSSPDRAEERTPLASLRGHTGAISAVALDAAGRVAASAGRDLTIRIWDMRAAQQRTDAGTCVLTGLSDRASHLAFNRDGSRLISISRRPAASHRDVVHAWAADSDESVSVLRGHTSYVYAVAFTPDGSRIVSGAWDGTIRIWDAASGEPCLVIRAEAGAVGALAVSPDGRTVVSGHLAGYWTGGAVHLWDLVTGEGRGTLRDKGPAVTALAFAPGGLGVIGATKAGPMFAIEASTGEEAAGFAPESAEAFAMALSHDGSLLASGHADHRVCVRDAPSGRTLRTLDGHAGPVHAAAFRPSKMLPSATEAARGGPAHAEDTGPDTTRRKLAGARHVLATGSADGTARLWDADTGRCLGVLERHWDAVYALAFSPDGRALATGSNDTSIRIWDGATCEEATQLRGHDAYVYSLAFSPDGRMLVSGSGDSTVRVWDTRPLHERWRARAAGRSP